MGARLPVVDQNTTPVPLQITNTDIVVHPQAVSDTAGNIPAHEGLILP